MSSRPMIMVLVMLCIGTAVNCMPKRNGKSRRQAHQGETKIPSVSSVSQDGCIDNGQMYNINDQWERSYLGTMLVCTCHGVAGIKCKTKPEAEETCYDKINARSYQVGETYERPKEGMIWDCTCIGSGRGKISCTIASEWAPERCYDNTAGTSYVVGETWEKPYQGWMIVDCTCLGEGSGRITCTSRNTWSKTDARGHMLQCLCTGNGRGEWKCERHASLHTTGLGTGSRVITNIQPAVYHPHPQPGQEPPPGLALEGACQTDAGVAYALGMRWIKTQGSKQMLCTCLGNGGPAPVYGGNSNGQPCVFPFTYMGKTYHSCTSEGRPDGQLWCCISSDCETEQKYSFCTKKNGNSNGALCQFPFLYNGRNYTDCTADGRRDGMKWCGTTTNYDGEQRFGFCPMAAHEEVCTTSEGVMYRVGDQWDKRHDVLGHMMRCTCVGNGRGEWSCIAYSQLKDQCIVDGLTYEVNQTFTKLHEEGYMMNCTCFGQGRGRWKCDAIDQCQEPETRVFYQIGQSWDKLIHGVMYKCYCYGNGIGELSCEPQQSFPGGNRPVQVIITESGNQPNSHPIQWNAPPSAHITQYILKWRVKNTRTPWREVNIPGHLNSYTIAGLKPGITYEGQLISVLRFGRREVTRFDFTTTYGSLATSEGETTQPPPVVDISESVTEITSSSFVISWMSASDTEVHCECVRAPDAPSDHEVDEVGETSIIVSWEKPLAPITEGSNNGAATELTLPDTATSVTLSDLRPGLLYNISIYAVEDSLESEPVFVQVNTAGDPLPEEVPSPTDLQFFEVSDVKITITWMGPPTDVSGYRVTVAPVGPAGTPRRELQLPITHNAYAEVTHLTPGTPYRFSIYTIKGGEESQPLVGEQATKPDSPADVHFTNVTEDSALIAWVAPRARITGYRLFLTLEGSNPKQLRLPARLSQYTLLNLRPDTEYTAVLHAEQDNTLSEGTSRTFSTTQLMGNAPRFSTDVTDTSIIISWTPVPQVGYKRSATLSPPTDLNLESHPDSGELTVQWNEASTPDITGYRVTCTPTNGQRGNSLEEFVKAGETSCTLENLSPGVEYNVSVFTVKDDMESVPVSTTVTQDVPRLTDLNFVDVTDTTIGLRWNPLNYTAVTGYRITVTAAGESVPIFEDMVEATTGYYTVHGLEPGIDYDISVITVTESGESEPTTLTQQTAVPAPTNLGFPEVGPDSMQVTWTAPVVPNPADINSFRESSPLVGTHKTTLDSPSGLRFSEVLTNSFTVHWLAPNAIITGYRIRYQMTSGGRAKDERLPPSRNHFTLTGLTPETEYIVNIYAVSGQQDSKPLTGKQKTISDAPTDLEVVSSSPTSITIRWDAPLCTVRVLQASPMEEVPVFQGSPMESGHSTPKEFTVPGSQSTATIQNLRPGTDYTITVYAGPVQGYRITGVPRNGQGPSFSETVAPDQTEMTFSGLQPTVEYILSVYALGQDGESLPLVETAVTAVGRPTDLTFSNVDSTSMTISWDSPDGRVTSYRVLYAGPEEGERELRPAPRGDDESATIHGLRPGSEYTVKVIAMHDRTPSPPLVGVQATDISPPRRVRISDVKDSSITLTWRSKTETISGFLVEATPTTGGRTPIQRTITPDSRAYTIQGLQPGTTYKINIYTLNGNGRSAPFTLTATTAKPVVSPPTNIRFTSLTPSSISFTWEGSRRTEYIIKIVTLQNALRSTPLVGRARTQLASQLPVPQLPVSHRPSPDILDVPEDEVNPNLPTDLDFNPSNPSFNTNPNGNPNYPANTNPNPNYPANPNPNYNGNPNGNTNFNPANPNGKPNFNVNANPNPNPNLPLNPNGNPNSNPNQFNPNSNPNQFNPNGNPNSNPNQFNPNSNPNQFNPNGNPNQFNPNSNPNGNPNQFNPNQFNPNTNPNQFNPNGNPNSNPNQFNPNGNPNSNPNQFNPNSNPNQFNPNHPLNPNRNHNLNPNGNPNQFNPNTNPKPNFPLNPNTNPNTNPNGNPNFYGSGNLNPISNPNTNPNPNLPLNPSGNPNPNYNGNVNPNYPLNPNGNPNTNPNPNFNTNPNPNYPLNPNGNPNTNPNPNYPLNPNGNPNTNPNPNFNTNPSTNYPLNPNGNPNTNPNPNYPLNPNGNPNLNPNFNDNHFQLVGTNGQDTLGQQGQHIYTEYQSLGPNPNGRDNQGQGPAIHHREPLVYVPVPGPDGQRVPLVRVNEGPLSGLPFGFPENDTGFGVPQEAQTHTTISWQGLPQSSEYLVSCNPITNLDEKMFQMRLPGTSTSATLIGLTPGASYGVVVEAMRGQGREKVLEEIVTVGNAVPGDNLPSSRDVCYDTFTATYHDVGAEWERMSETGFKLWCRCLGLGSGHFRCDSSKWCHDSGNNYHIGEKWDRHAENGHMMSCTCLGNGKGEFKCEPHESTCYDDGNMYQVGNQWQKEYLGAICTCTCYGGQQGWRCENCRRPGAQTEVDVDLLDSQIHQDAFDRYRENALKKLNIQCPIECLRPELLADSQQPSE
ncbi:unnamed protein product [Coregonus sp. 'balchen']|nr:unnamed protein product [Coregonus sp. 'balchen']